MHVLSLLHIIRYVLTDKNVIIAAVGVLLYVNFAFYVANYRKKPPKVKKTRPVAQPKPKPKAEEASDDEENADEE